MASAAEYEDDDDEIDFSDLETEDDMSEEMNPALRNIPSGELDVVGSSMPVNFMSLALVALYYLNPDVIGTFTPVRLDSIHPPDFTAPWKTIKTHDNYKVVMKKTRLLIASRESNANVYYICIIQEDISKAIWNMAFIINYPLLF